LNKKITYPLSLDLKIMSEITEVIPTHSKSDEKVHLADITIYTDKNSYEGKLTKNCVN
jgi:hypothetical protein